MTVHLVGAGPGDPELLTLRAARLLAAADVVVHDRLAALATVAADPRARLIDVGKSPGGGGVPQATINELLVDLGRTGQEIVRLKGGDPFVFGRGGEEALALAEAGVPFTVVPGITSAIAAPAAAGIPVTHRGVAASFTVVTGHRAPGEDDVDWDALAKLGGTIVILMGVANRSAIAEKLIAAGVGEAASVAAIRSASQPDQEIVRCQLGELAATHIRAPSTIVIEPTRAAAVPEPAGDSPRTTRPNISPWRGAGSPPRGPDAALDRRLTRAPTTLSVSQE